MSTADRILKELYDAAGEETVAFLPEQAGIFYQLGRLSPSGHAALTEALRAAQNEDGAFCADPERTAAFVAALELLGSSARYPVPVPQELSVYSLLCADPQEDLRTLFRHFSSTADPQTGFWNRERYPECAVRGAFAAIFAYGRRRVPLPYPDRMIDTCLSVPKRELQEDPCGLGADWVYALHRAMRQSGHRFAEGKGALVGFRWDFSDLLSDGAIVCGMSDRFRAVSILNELSAALPDLADTTSFLLHPLC